MSGIVGLWNLDGRPVDEAVLSGMSNTLRHRGPDGNHRCVSGSIGLAHQHLWITAEEVGEMQPLVGPGGVLLALDGRLDNRDELIDMLRVPPAASDAACALAAYEKWADGFAERLNGDFAIAIFDPREPRLLLARDSIGIRPLYYVRNESLVAFASEIKALLTHPDVPARPDDEGLADYLLVSSRPIEQQDITCFANVRSLVPAHLAAITPDRTVTRRYWDFDTTRTIRYRSFDEYAAAFRERFTEAVRRRVRSAHPVAMSVSGGLDSSSIFCQAHALRCSSASTFPGVFGVAYCGAEGSDADEQRYLLHIEQQYEARIDRFPIEPHIGLVQGAEDQVRAIEAPFLDHMWGVTREVQRRARMGGSRTLLSGHWGDQVLFSSAYLVDLFRRAAWKEVFRHLREYARWFGPAEAKALQKRFVFDVARRHVPDPIAPPLKWLRRRLRDVRSPRRWFSPAFLRNALRFSNRPARLDRPFHSAHARAVYLEARSKYHVQCMEWNNKVGALHGLDAAFPFLDRDLLAYLMAIPGEIQNRDGVPRALLRAGMRGVLPEPIRARVWKADFSRVVNDGVSRDIEAIVRTLASESLGVRYGYFDPTRLEEEVARVAAALAGPDCLGSWDLSDLFGLEVWLRVFSNARAGEQVIQAHP
jgi:asparagine synthase (glutamine-hydrolysing)